MPELPDSDAVLAQFNRLIKEVLDGTTRRNTFQPWEIDVLLDIEGCDLGSSPASKGEALRRYQNAVKRQMEKGAHLPLKLSEYLAAVKTKAYKPSPPHVSMDKSVIGQPVGD